MYNYFRIIYHLANLNRHTYWSSDRLVDYQNRKLRKIVKYAYEHVPFYHDKFREYGLKPSEIKNVKDLNKLPIVRKEELQKNAEKTISNEFHLHDLEAESTSGSTGQPLFYYLTRSENEFRKAKLLRANMGCGQKPRDRWVVITSPFYATRSKMARFQRLLRIFAPVTASVFDETDAQISLVNQVQPDVLEGYSSSLLLMAKEIEKKGIEISKPRLVIGGADLLGNYERRFIEKAFKAPFYDQYGCNELEVLAWQCQAKGEYHIDADTTIMQFLDKNGEEVSPGERGEIVCTSLFNRAMPFIRYAVGDVGVLSEETECSCGRTLPLMKLVEGRTDSLIVLPNGRLVSPIVFILLMRGLKFFNNIDHYRIIQKKVNLIEFHIKMKKDVFDKKIVEDELVQHFRKALNVDADSLAFEVEFVKDFSLDKSGKLAAVVSELKNASDHS